MITTLDEAITHAKEVAKENREIAKDVNAYSYEEYEACLECAKEHEQLAAWLTELAERREADRWIPVSERLPDKNGKCLVSLDFGDVSFDYYDKDWGFVCYVGNVIAWKSMPKHYTESEDK